MTSAARTVLVVFTLLIALVGSAGLVAAQMHAAGASSSVPELTAFHAVIQPMWHDAYPAKDYAALRRFAPEVQAGVAKIAAATLPGMLHEKEAAWAKGVAALKATAEAYARAAAGTNDSALLVAAENLHTDYEALVRVIRPVVQEMDDFHKILYVVNHTYAPEKNWGAVCGVSQDLLTKAEALAKATLPKRVDAKADEFRKASAGLVDDARALVEACGPKRAAAVEKAVDALHTRYQGLEKIFE